MRRWGQVHVWNMLCLCVGCSARRSRPHQSTPPPPANRRTKAAAEELQKAASAAQKVAEEARQQAARATSALGEKVSQATTSAQKLAKETVQEMVGGSSGGAGQQQKEQQQQQQEGGGEASSSSSSSSSSQQQQQQQQQKKAARAPLGTRLRAAAQAALREMRATLSAETAQASALRAPAKGGDLQAAGTSAVMVAPEAARSAWQKQWSEMRDKVRGCRRRGW